jgi:iron-sulfur cluster insertion protein
MQAVDFTASAASKVYALMAEEDDFNLKFRAYISGGGCSGFQYGFTFDEAIAQDDTKIVTTIRDDLGKAVDVLLLVDAISYPYLQGATIDYREDVQGAQFVIKNPNAKTTCGCGASFSVAEGGDDGPDAA